MRVRWLPEAWQDTQRLYDFLVDQDPGTAARAMDTLLSGADRLAEMPEIGRPMGDDTRRRELYLPIHSNTRLCGPTHIQAITDNASLSTISVGNPVDKRRRTTPGQ